MPAERGAQPLSSSFHPQLVGLLSGRAIIDSVPTRALHTASALAGLAGLSLLLTACGGSSSPGVAALGTTSSSVTTTTTGQSGQAAALSFSSCMRSHGVPNFPDPDAQWNFPSFETGVSKQTSAAASDACKHLMRNGGTGTPQQRRQKFAFALKVAQCLRKHGYPTFPDPTGSGQRIPPGIDTQSPQFQMVETSCEQQEQKALGLP